MADDTTTQEPAAPAATETPVTPAAPAASVPAQQQTLAEAIDAARKAAQSEIPHHSTDQPRDESGRFQEGSAAEPEGVAVPAEDGIPNEGQETGDEEQPETPEGAEPETVEDAAPEPIRVAIPGRNPTDPDVEIEVEDQQVADRLRQLRNQAMNGLEVKEARQALRQERAELDEVRDLIQTDPVGFVHDQLPVEYRSALTLQMLADPAVLTEEVAEQVYALLDQDRAPLVRAEMKAQRLEMRDQHRARVESQRRLTAAREQVESGVEAIAEEVGARMGWSPRQIALFEQDCKGDVARRLRDPNARIALDEIDVPMLLENRLLSLGFNPVQAADAISRRLQAGAALPGNGNGATPATPAAPAKRAAVKARPVQPTVDQLRAQDERRRQAAAAAPPGDIAPAMRGLDLPPGARPEDVIEAARKRLRQSA